MFYVFSDSLNDEAVERVDQRVLQSLKEVFRQMDPSSKSHCP